MANSNFRIGLLVAKSQLAVFLVDQIVISLFGLGKVIKYPFYRPKYRHGAEANSGNRAAYRFPPSNFVCLESDPW